MDGIKRILLVEDDPKDAELTLSALSEYSLANLVVVARDGVEAFDYLHSRGTFAGRPEGNPVVILLDIKMPRMDGIEFLRRLKGDDELRLIPVVVMTSSRESRDVEECYHLGANAYVVKPVRFPEFAETVKRIGVFWVLLNELPADKTERF